MPANINSYAGTGEAWHGLGKKLTEPMTSAEILAAAQLKWKVSKQQVYLANGKEVPDSFAVVREDSGDALGVVGKSYKPLQNEEIAARADQILGLKGSYYETAGALGLGEKVWLLAKFPGEDIRVIKDDIVKKYILFASSHDGTMAFNILFTPIRVVCQNTLNMALETAENKQSVRHTVNMGLAIDQVQRNLGIISQKFAIFEDASKALASKSLTPQGFSDYLRALNVTGTKDGAAAEPTGKTKAIIEEVSTMFEHGRGNDLAGVKGTLWGALNAVVEYADYSRGSESTRTESLLFGSGAALKQRAWNAALQLVK